MKVVRLSNVPTEEATSALFTGNVVTRQAPVEAGDSNNFNFGLVSFSAGSRNKFHKHSGDQILIVTEGTGTVATDDEEVEVNRGGRGNHPRRREPLARRPRRHGDGPYHGNREGQPDRADRTVSSLIPCM